MTNQEMPITIFFSSEKDHDINNLEEGGNLSTDLAGDLQILDLIFLENFSGQKTGRFQY